MNWEARAVKSFSMAELEARKLKYPNTGTESLLLGILTEGEHYFWNSESMVVDRMVGIIHRFWLIWY